jgi:hypothetical protein
MEKLKCKNTKNIISGNNIPTIEIITAQTRCHDPACTILPRISMDKQEQERKMPKRMS